MISGGVNNGVMSKEVLITGVWVTGVSNGGVNNKCVINIVYCEACGLNVDKLLLATSLAGTYCLVSGATPF